MNTLALSRSLVHLVSSHPAMGLLEATFGTALKRVGRMRVAHPVRRSPPQLLGKRGIRVGQDIGRRG